MADRKSALNSASGEPSADSWTLNVPSEATKAIIGRRGHIIRDVQKDTDTVITCTKLPNDPEQSALVFTHPRMHLPALAKAVSMTLKKLDEASLVRLSFPIVRGIDDEVKALLDSLSASENLAGVLSYQANGVNDVVEIGGVVPVVLRAMFSTLEHVVQLDMKSTKRLFSPSAPGYRDLEPTLPSGPPPGSAWSAGPPSLAGSSLLSVAGPPGIIVEGAAGPSAAAPAPAKPLYTGAGRGAGRGGAPSSTTTTQAGSAAPSGMRSPCRLFLSAEGARRIIGRGGRTVAAIERLSGVKVHITVAQQTEVLFYARTADNPGCLLALCLALDEASDDTAVLRIAPGPTLGTTALELEAKHAAVNSSSISGELAMAGPTPNMRTLARNMFEAVAGGSGDFVQRRGLVSYNTQVAALSLAEGAAGALIGKGGKIKKEIQAATEARLGINFRRDMAVVTVEADTEAARAAGVIGALARLDLTQEVQVQLPRALTAAEAAAPRTRNADAEQANGAGAAVGGEEGRKSGPVELGRLHIGETELAAYLSSHAAAASIIDARDKAILISGQAGAVRDAAHGLLALAGIDVALGAGPAARPVWQLEMGRRSANLLTGKGRHTLNEIEAAVSCAVQMDYKPDQGTATFLPPESDADSTSIEAQAKGMLVALARLRADDEVTAIVPGSGRRVATGSAPDDVDVSEKGDSLVLKGPAGQVRTYAVSVIRAHHGLDLGALTAQWQLSVSGKHARSVIGRGGAGLKDLREGGCAVNFVKSSLVIARNTNTPIAAGGAGASAGASAAAGKEDRNAAAFGQFFTLLGKIKPEAKLAMRVPMPTKKAADQFQTLANSSDFTRAVSLEDRTVVLSGRPAVVGRALVAAVPLLGLRVPEGIDTTAQWLQMAWDVMLPRSALGRVIGRDGKALKDLQDAYSVRVNIIQRSNPMLEIRGNTVDSLASAAVHMLNDVKDEGEVAVSFRAFESFPVPRTTAGDDSDDESSSDEEEGSEHGASQSSDNKAEEKPAKKVRTERRHPDVVAWVDGPLARRGTGGATVTCPGGDEVKVAGRPVAVLRGVATVFSVAGRGAQADAISAKQAVRWQLDMPTACGGFIIGKGGSGLNELQDTTETAVTVRNQETSAAVGIEGSVVGVVKCVVLALGRLATVDASLKLSFPLLAEWDSGCGPRLERYAREQQAAAARPAASSSTPAPATITFTRDRITLEGTQVQLEHTLLQLLNKVFLMDAAAFSVAAAAPSLGTGGYAWSLDFPRRFVGRIIGSGGKSITAFNETMNVLLDPKYQKNSVVVTMKLAETEGVPDFHGKMTLLRAARAVADHFAEDTEIVLAIPTEGAIADAAASLERKADPVAKSLSVSRVATLVKGTVEAVINALTTLLRVASGRDKEPLHLPPVVITPTGEGWALQVPLACTGLVLGKAGKAKVGIQESTGVVMEVMSRALMTTVTYAREAAADDNATAQGRQLVTALVMTLDSLAQAGDIDVDVQMSLSNARQAKAIGAALGSVAGVVSRWRGDSTLLLTGQRAAVRGAMVGVLGSVLEGGAVARDLTALPWRLEVPADAAKVILGRGGSTIKRLTESTGVQLTFKDRDEKPTVHLLAGERGAVAQAVLAVFDLLPDTAHVRLAIPVSMLGDAGPTRMTGKGKTASLLRNEGDDSVLEGAISQVRPYLVMMCAADLDARGVDSKAAANPVKLVRGTVNTPMLQMPSASMGLIIGRAGATIKEIRAEAGCDIEMDSGKRGGGAAPSATATTTIKTTDLALAAKAMVLMVTKLRDSDEIAIQCPLYVDDGATASTSAGAGAAAEGAAAAPTGPDAATKSRVQRVLKQLGAMGGAGTLEHNDKFFVVRGPSRPVLSLFLRVLADALGVAVEASREAVKGGEVRWHVVVGASVVGLLIGKGGKNMQETERKFSQKVTINRTAAEADMSFGAATTSIEVGAPVAFSMIERLDDDEDVTVRVPLAAMSATTSATPAHAPGSNFVVVYHGTQSERAEDIVRLTESEIVLSGSGRAVRVALQGLVNQATGSEAGTAEIVTHQSQLGKLIGKGGETVRALETESGATIKVARDRGEWVAVTVSGTPAVVTKALDAIARVLERDVTMLLHNFGRAFYIRTRVPSAIDESSSSDSDSSEPTPVDGYKADDFVPADDAAKAPEVVRTPQEELQALLDARSGPEDMAAPAGAAAALNGLLTLLEPQLTKELISTLEAGIFAKAKGAAGVMPLDWVQAMMGVVTAQRLALELRR